MQSLSRKALLVFLALLVLDLLVRLWASRGTSGPVGVENLTMDPDQVSALEILAGKERLVLERTPQGFERIDNKSRESIKSREPSTSSQEKEGNVTSREPLTAAEKQGVDVTLRKPLSSTQTREVEAFLKRICSMVRERVGAIAEENLSAYGLDPDHGVSIRLYWQKTAQSRRPFTVGFGTSLPLNVMYVYASFSDTPGLFKVLRTYRESAVTLLRSVSP
jgi:hypothetical protein